VAIANGCPESPLCVRASSKTFNHYVYNVPYCDPFLAFNTSLSRTLPRLQVGMLRFPRPTIRLRAPRPSLIPARPFVSARASGINTPFRPTASHPQQPRIAPERTPFVVSIYAQSEKEKETSRAPCLASLTQDFLLSSAGCKDAAMREEKSTESFQHHHNLEEPRNATRSASPLSWEVPTVWPYLW